MIEKPTTRKRKRNENIDKTMKDIDDVSDQHIPSNDLYEILEVARTAEIHEIKANYY